MENNQRNSRKRLNSLILLVAFTAIMLIVSTYAWFSAQKTVTLGGLTGTVNVAEGLEISLDAKHWSQEVDFSKFATNQNNLKRQYAVKTNGDIDTTKTYDDGNLTHETEGYKDHNIIPSELLPVSTTATSTNGIGLPEINMYRGIVGATSTSTNLTEVITVHQDTTSFTAYDGENTDTVVRPQDHDYPGYYAIDLFLRNSTKTSESGKDTYSEILQLNTTSKLELKNSNALTTGLQNTVRVAFAAYEADSTAAPGTDGAAATSEQWAQYLATATKSDYMTASQAQILAAYKGQNIRDVAIWEPNASDHVQYIVDNNASTPKFSLADYKIYNDENADAIEDVVNGLHNTSQAMRTYALVKAADTANSVTQIYDWATPAAGTAAQVTLQTEKKSASDYAIADGVKNLVSVTSPATKKYTTGDATTEAGVVNFKIGDGTVAKIRMYVWLEGQDIDCVNYASHGGGIDLDVGFLKDGEVGQS